VIFPATLTFRSIACQSRDGTVIAFVSVGVELVDRGGTATWPFRHPKEANDDGIVSMS
jgi:hypothetical protein